VARERRTKGLARKQAIVDAAVALIAENGTQPLWHRAAARRAGVPDSAPSYYFESIEQLTLEAFRAAIRLPTSGARSRRRSPP
jgi:DNA-binding transcriptional regulator YbjK